MKKFIIFLIILLTPLISFALSDKEKEHLIKIPEGGNPSDYRIIDRPGGGSQAVPLPRPVPGIEPRIDTTSSFTVPRTTLENPPLRIGEGGSYTRTSGPSGCVSLRNNPKFQDLLNYISYCIIGAFIPLIFAVAVIFFFIGIIKYVMNVDDAESKAKGRQFIIWGLIALAVMFSVWGLVEIITNTFGVKFVVPQVQGQ